MSFVEMFRDFRLGSKGDTLHVNAACPLHPPEQTQSEGFINVCVRPEAEVRPLVAHQRATVAHASPDRVRATVRRVGTRL